MSREIIIAASMLSADFGRLKEEVAALEEAGADWLHWDCMDGHFTVPLTHGPLVLQALRPHTSLFFDAHLMITQPEKQIPAFVDAGADVIAIHYEAIHEPAALLEDIRLRGCKACLAVNPSTPIAKIEPLLSYCDVIMLMGVEPGYAGQTYMEVTDQRIQAMREAIERAGLQTLIEVDGGVNVQTARRVIAAGADVLVSASFIFQHPQGYKTAISDLRRVAAEIS